MTTNVYGERMNWFLIGVRVLLAWQWLPESWGDRRRTTTKTQEKFISFARGMMLMSAVALAFTYLVIANSLGLIHLGATVTSLLPPEGSLITSLFVAGKGWFSAQLLACALMGLYGRINHVTMNDHR